jgi:AmiR/NasT family two-component response regulator
MLKVLVCINDGLLKLRINRLLSEKNYQFTITDKPIKRADLFQFDVVIIHSTYRITDLYNFIEHAVLQELTTIMYITTNVNSNPFRKLNDHSNLVFIDENKLDIELNVALAMFQKYAKRISTLTNENRDLEERLTELQLMNRCKRKLMQDDFTEETAHQYILKYAMDHHISKIEACKRLLAVNSD